MNALILDFDGVTATGSQEAKELSWLLAVLYLQEKLAPSVFEGLKTNAEGLGEAMEAASRYPAELGVVQSLRGMSRRQTGTELVRLLRLESSAAELTAARDSIRGTLIRAMIQPMPGVMDLVRNLSSLGRPWGIVSQTTSASILSALTRFGFPDAPTVLEGAGDPFYSRFSQGVDAKSVAYAMACRRLDVLPWQVIAIEDSLTGVRAAKNVGIYVVAIVPPSLGRIPEADLILNTPDLRPLASAQIVATLAREEPREALRIISPLLGANASQ